MEKKGDGKWGCMILWRRRRGVFLALLYVRCEDGETNRVKHP